MYAQRILRYGPAYAPTPHPKGTLRNCILDLERLLQGMSDIQKEYYRWLASCKLKKGRDSVQIIRFRDDLSRTAKWICNNNLTLIRADKTKALVIMRRETYEKGLREYIDVTRCVEAENNAIDKIQSKVKQFSNTKLASRLGIRNIITDAPDTPKLFAFAKTHKQGQKLRPVVDKARAPTRKLEASLHNIIAPHLEGYRYTISNPTELVELLKVTEHPTYITVMDFRTLYPSIEIPPCFCRVRDLLFKILRNEEFHQQVLELSHLICYSSIFQFGGVTHMQGKGVPMGSSVSGDMCELVIRQLENATLPNFHQNIIIYKRYVDDIIILWRGCPNNSQLLDQMNNNPYGLTVEVEQHSDSSVHFLNVNIDFSRPIIQTSVYRKPSDHPTYITADSCDPVQYKMAAFRALVKRAYSHSSTQEALEHELQFLCKVAKHHGYHNIVQKMSQKFGGMVELPLLKGVIRNR
ncbi:uncharacterized protein LOC111617643 [Centruroides sculpturatus]|uniref:uncharacterized protein LOC111617643 n=1 Tax=Centruroides sculpturatus TaxID=218467 RepID=UPI000C6CD10B|nr:uncharacterized protein LOC111617643 [Centruroides sculpturatus]